jgi:hypothetical protein
MCVDPVSTQTGKAAELVDNCVTPRKEDAAVVAETFLITVSG